MSERGGEPIGPRLSEEEGSCCWLWWEEVRGGRGVLKGRGAGEDLALTCSSSSMSPVAASTCTSGTDTSLESAERLSATGDWEVRDCAAGAEGSLLDSSGRPNEAKSVSLSGGAGAEGEMVALRDIGMGARDDVPVRILVGADEPDKRPPPEGRPPPSAPFPPSRSPLPCPDDDLCTLPPPPGPLFSLSALSPPSRPPPPPPPLLPAVWAAFLFFLSIAIDWPGRMWASAHLWPNLQLPFMNQAQVSLCWPGSRTEWEKGQDEPAVHEPTLKNLQGTWERSFAVRLR